MQGAMLHLVVDFPERLAKLRKQRNLSQQQLAEAAGVHFTQIRRYEAGTSQPTLSVLKELAKALRVSADVLVFDENERGPSDDLRVYFEAIEKLDRGERKVVKEVLDALLLKHDAKKWAAGG
jgi:transcriptional regulator with XRE-family HTH domain